MFPYVRYKATHNVIFGLSINTLIFRRVQKNPNNWTVHSMCLLQKSRLEFESTKTADRAVLQMQVTVLLMLLHSLLIHFLGVGGSIL